MPHIWDSNYEFIAQKLPWLDDFWSMHEASVINNSSSGRTLRCLLYMRVQAHFLNYFVSTAAVKSSLTGVKSRRPGNNCFWINDHWVEGDQRESRIPGVYLTSPLYGDGKRELTLGDEHSMQHIGDVL